MLDLLDHLGMNHLRIGEDLIDSGVIGVAEGEAS